MAEDGSTPGVHATITGAGFTSHVPALGAALDQDKTDDPYWSPVFDGYEPIQAVDPQRATCPTWSSWSTTTTPARST